MMKKTRESNLLKFINKNQKEIPFYYYSIDQIKRGCRYFLDIPYKNKTIHFALMANDNLQLLRIIKEAGIFVFVNSLEHLKLVKKLGFKNDEIIFTASAMTDVVMKTVWDIGALVNLDSISQIKKWHKITNTSAFGIRCNIGELVTPLKTRGGYYLGKHSRLGLSIDEIRSIAGDSNVEGLHIYVGTDIMEISYFLECYEALTEFVFLFPNLKYLDFGGGFGITSTGDTNFDFQNYSKMLTKLMENISTKIGRSIRLILEPGRILCGKAGSFVCRVVDIKKIDNKQYIGVDASSVQFPRPLFYPDDTFHPVHVYGNTVTEKIKTVIYGCSTYSRDFLARDIYLSPLKEGDILIFKNAGAYCSALYTQFLGFPKPLEFFQ
jgi:diaminopimelate decarboxylase